MAKRYAKLRGRIVERYGSLGSFAEALGITRTSLSYKLSGQRRFNSEEIIEWAKLLGVRTTEIGNYFFE